MRISVIITTYNRPHALVKVLEGLLHQTRAPDEIIVADDGSGQGTRDMLAPYLKINAPPVYHVWQEDKGFRAAMIRNRAILKATGDYLILLDGDCIPGPQFVSDHGALAEQGRFFQGKRVLVNRKLAQNFSRKDISSFLTLAGHALTGGIANGHHILRPPYFPSFRTKKLSGIRSCNMGLFRKDALAVNGFNHDFIGWGREDTEFVVRLTRYGLLRKENPFRAICFHLWHKENSRDQLSKNDQILDAARQEGGYFARIGINTLNTED